MRILSKQQYFQSIKSQFYIIHFLGKVIIWEKSSWNGFEVSIKLKSTGSLIFI